MAGLTVPSGAFPQAIERSMEVVRRILDQTKNPMAAGDVDHRYEDKFALVEFLTNTGIAATLNVLEQLDGFNEDVLKQICVVVQGQKRSMTLRLAVEEDCEFVEEALRTMESPTSQTTVDETIVGSPASSTVYSHKVVKQVKEYHWKAGVRHILVLFAGTDPSAGMTLGSRTGTTRLVTSTNKPPFPPSTRPPIDLDLTWLINQINQESLESSFVIQREESKTPRRNKQTKEAIRFFDSLSRWSYQSLNYFCRTIQEELLRNQAEASPTDWLQKIEASSVFTPILPLFQEYDDGQANNGNNSGTVEKCGVIALRAPPTGSPILPLKDSSLFLKEQCSTLSNTLLDLAGNFADPSDQSQIASAYESKLVLLWNHLRDLSQQWRRGVDYVEEMLYSQLVSAVGKEVQETDFHNFLKFHNQRLFGRAFSPKPFCYAIRQPNQYPDGELSILWTSSNFFGTAKTSTPIETFSRCVPGDSLVTPMSIPLNAATTVEFMGDQFLHGWMDTKFTSQPSGSLSISARARQFSSFLLVTGNISGPNEFKPNDAIIIQNKDEVLIELLAATLPSAKEFRDTIKSLSPEQARFAKSYRAMQLDSSVFGIWIVQVKPQMEALLDLPPGALTKEIQLSQDLLSLFVEYQIPPSLVSFDGEASTATVAKVEKVKQYVKGVVDVIHGVKQNQLQEEQMKKEAALAQDRTFAPHAGGFGGVAAANSFGASPAVFAQDRASGPYSVAYGGNTAVNSFGTPPAPDAFGSPALPAPPAPAPSSLFGSPAPAAFRSPPLPKAPAFESATTAAPSSAPPVIQARSKESAEADTIALDLSEGFDVLQDQFSDLQLGGTNQHSDFSAIPKQLDHMFESFDKDGALRTMTIKTGETLMRKRQKNILTNMETNVLHRTEKKSETDKALDLLDALSRSGSLPIVSGELHVIVGVCHSFEKNVMATVIEENINPIEKVDYSSLLIAASVHEAKIPALLANGAEPPALALKNQEFPPSMGSRIEGDA